MANNRYIIKNAMPAACWQDASPLGNGKVGAMVYGSIYDERILLNEESLFAGGIDKDIPDISNSLIEVRRLLDCGEYVKADNLYPELLVENGFLCRTGDFAPAFDIHMISTPFGAFSNYKRELDIFNGISRVGWSDGGIDFLRESFVSSVSGNFIMRYTASKPMLTFDIRLEQHDLADAVNISGDSIEPIYNYNFDVHKDMLHASSTTSCNQCNALLSVYGDGEIELVNCKNQKKLNDMQGSANFDSNYYSIVNASTVDIVCKVYKSEKDTHSEYLRLSTRRDYAELLREHSNQFSKNFSSMTIDISDDSECACIESELINSYNGNVPSSLVQKMLDFGRYLLVSSSVNCDLPANLQGLWNGSYCPPWSSTFFNNENIQMCYWQALQGNLSNAMLPLFDLYLSFMDDYRHNAKRLYGCSGILLPLFLDNISGKKKNLQSHVLYWTASSSWAANLFYDYYDYTLDEDFLRTKAYPFMAEAALFYEDFMVEEGGKLKSYPANSPENCARSIYNWSETVRVSINATMDFASLKQLLINLLASAKKIDIPQDKINKWKDMLGKIPKYQINGEGALKEWLHPDFLDNYKHRHLSQIYPLFPGIEVSKEQNLELFNACNIAVDKRLEFGLKEQTGWSLAHIANILARLNDGDRALEVLNLILRFCTGNNLFAYHNDWRNQGVTLKFLWSKRAPYQIDANMGFSAAVIEMLLFSANNQIKLLPALPSNWKKGSIKHCKARGNIDVCIEWDNGKVIAALCSPRNACLEIFFGTTVHQIACSYRYVRISNGIAVDLKANQTLGIELT